MKRSFETDSDDLWVFCCSNDLQYLPNATYAECDDPKK